MVRRRRSGAPDSISRMLRSLNLMIMGAAGSGKGTMSKKLIKDFNFTHLSSGDLLRKHVAEGSALGKEAKEYMNKGDLVPDRLVESMIRDFYGSSNKASLLLDGYPRTLVQAQRLNSIFKVDVVVALDIPHDTIVERLGNRWTHIPSGRVYTYDKYSPPKRIGFDDITGEKLEQRTDDKPETIRRRLDSYESTTKPLLDFYRASGNTIVKSFKGTESDVIYPEIKEFLLSNKELLKL